jgi:addiction module HigA family antidote
MSSSSKIATFASRHPGTILRETLDDLGISIDRLARELRLPANRIGAIVAGKRGITTETALRLGRFFDSPPDYWLNLQAGYELEIAHHAWESGIASEVRPYQIE